LLAPSQLNQFEEQGFLLVPGLLDPKAELAALETAYQDLIETLALIHFGEAGGRPPNGFRDRSLGERFALMLGASGGHAVEHLDPAISAFTDGHRRRGDLPSAQIPELFRLMRSGTLLDALESLLGPEIDGSPVYHVNFKLAEPHQALARETARRLDLPDPARRPPSRLPRRPDDLASRFRLRPAGCERQSDRRRLDPRHGSRRSGRVARRDPGLAPRSAGRSAFAGGAPRAERRDRGSTRGCRALRQRAAPRIDAEPERVGGPMVLQLPLPAARRGRRASLPAERPASQPLGARARAPQPAAVVGHLAARARSRREPGDAGSAADEARSGACDHGRLATSISGRGVLADARAGWRGRGPCAAAPSRAPARARASPRRSIRAMKRCVGAGRRPGLPARITRPGRRRPAHDPKASSPPSSSASRDRSRPTAVSPRPPASRAACRSAAPACDGTRRRGSPTS
jgi:hypothetical protein